MTTAPDAALLRWASAIPSVRCIAPAIRPWTGAKDSHVVPISKTARFDEHGTTATVLGLSTVAQGAKPTEYQYLLARVPSQHAVVLDSGSDPDESSFTAVLGEASSPPRAVASLAKAPRTRDGLGLGSSRAEVERALGPAHPTALCGYDVVRYQPLREVMSESEMWIVYRHGRVVAFARYQAV